LNDHQAFAPRPPPAQQQDPKQPINTTEVRAPSSAALQHGNLVTQRDPLQQQRGAGSGSFRATGASLVGVAMKAGYSQTSETANKSVQVKF
jgi:hypothetical protein